MQNHSVDLPPFQQTSDRVRSIHQPLNLSRAVPYLLASLERKHHLNSLIVFTSVERRGHPWLRSTESWQIHKEREDFQHPEDSVGHRLNSRVPSGEQEHPDFH
tara:strand:- start:712 stop:1020 length:309 start_codon:yes stop_codon:yes gene_type:complete